ncbi:MAG: CARDB domain-containing protein, partial [Verrucomicrobiota bacterium]
MDDILYHDESPFQDGIVAQAVNAVTASGALYFSSASNSGNQDSGTSGTWEGDFSDGGLAPSLLETGRLHNFSSGVNANTVLDGGSDLRVDLFWADPAGASTNDYDIYVLDSTLSYVVASSTGSQRGTQDPYESLDTISSQENIVIVKFSGAGRFLHLSTGRGELLISTQGSTRGHDCATNAFNVASTDANTSYPSAFTGGFFNPVEDKSSDGPRRVFFQANGTPITPGNFSASGGVVRQKPDITAADGVSTDLPYGGGLNPFYGTSAAAPHAAAIAALLKSSSPSLTPTQIRTILTGTALDIMGAGTDRDSGAGIVMAQAALQATPNPDLTKRTDSFSNLSPHAGDVVTASLTITNQTCSGGSANAGLFHVGFYGLSTSTSFAGLTPFHELTINGCAAKGTVSTNQNITIDPGTTPGIYYLGYKINDENDVGECSQNNNGIFYWTITVLAPAQPDLTKRTDSLSNSSPHAGDVVTASLTITNQSCSGGSANAGAFHVGIYWSPNSSFPGVTPFTEKAVIGCGANGTVSLTNLIQISAGTLPGVYYLGYKIDDENELAECNTGNNGIFYWTVTVLPDTTAPTLNVTSPTPGQRWSNVAFTANGTTSDNVAVANVLYSLNGLPWTTATTGNNWTNWTAQVALTPGTNTLLTYSVDASGNSSLTNSVSFQFV